MRGFFLAEERGGFLAKGRKGGENAKGGVLVLAFFEIERLLLGAV